MNGHRLRGAAFQRVLAQIKSAGDLMKMFMRARPGPPTRKVSMRFAVQSARIGAVLNRGSRRVLNLIVVFGLQVVQLNLLWVAGFHSHGAPMYVRMHRTGAYQAGDHRSPAGAAEFPCTACHIIRTNAARPSVGAPMPQVASCTAFCSVATSSRFHSHPSVVVYGRPPPSA